LKSYSMFIIKLYNVIVIEMWDTLTSNKLSESKSTSTFFEKISIVINYYYNKIKLCNFPILQPFKDQKRNSSVKPQTVLSLCNKPQKSLKTFAFKFIFQYHDDA